MTICFDGEKQILLSEIKERLYKADSLDGLAQIHSQLLCLFDAQRFTLWLCVPAEKVFHAAIDSAGFYSDNGIAIDSDDIICVCAITKRVLNITDAYDVTELLSIDKRLKFNPAYDRKIGFRTKQLLTAPLIRDDRYLLGVMQLANCVNRHAFGRNDETLAIELSHAMADTLFRLSSKTVTQRTIADLLTRHGINYDHGIEMAITDLIRRYREIKGRLEKIQGVLQIAE